MTPNDTKPGRHPRRIKLILPGLQLRLVLFFLGVACLALIAEYLVLASRLSELASSMPIGGNQLAAEMPGLLRDVLLIAFGILLPAILCFGVLITFRIAGPIYRFHQHLGAVARGQNPGLCHIRKHDELQDLCELINEALEEARRQGQQAQDGQAEVPEEQRRAS